MRRFKDPLEVIRTQAGPNEEQFLWMISEIEELRDQKDKAYNERNRVVAALAKLVVAISGDEPYKGRLRAGLKTDLGAEVGWTTVVFIDMPQPIGQVSWHIPDGERWLFASLPYYEGEWDGHTTEIKYSRLAQDL